MTHFSLATHHPISLLPFCNDRYDFGWVDRTTGELTMIFTDVVPTCSYPQSIDEITFIFADHLGMTPQAFMSMLFEARVGPEQARVNKLMDEWGKAHRW